MGVVKGPLRGVSLTETMQVTRWGHRKSTHVAVGIAVISIESTGLPRLEQLASRFQTTCWAAL